MSYAAHHKDFRSFVSHKAPVQGATVTKTAGVLRRLFDGFMGWRQKEVDRQMAHFLARSGGTFTDEIEREMTDRLLTSNWSVNWGPSNDRRFP
jgi:hypothetical protein